MEPVNRVNGENIPISTVDDPNIVFEYKPPLNNDDLRTLAKEVAADEEPSPWHFVCPEVYVEPLGKIFKWIGTIIVALFILGLICWPVLIILSK